MSAYKKYRDLVGNTPLIDLSHLLPDHCSDVTLLGKCEFMNPGFSVKDRIVAQILDSAQAEGRIEKGSRILAASSGNTGAAVAMMAALRGMQAVIVTTPKCSKEKMDAIRAYGAELIVADGSNGNYMEVAQQLAEDDPDLFDVDQYSNPRNPEAHYLTLGPEIWEQTGGAVTHLVCGASTGGTICGVSRYLKQQNNDVSVIMADPEGSILADYFRTGCLEKGSSFYVEGVGKGNVPDTMDFDFVDGVVKVGDEEAFEMCHHLAATDGLMVGGSSGLNVCGAIKVASRLEEPAVVVTVLVDSGLKYISKIFNPDWLDEKLGMSMACHS